MSVFSVHSDFPSSPDQGQLAQGQLERDRGAVQQHLDDCSWGPATAGPAGTLHPGQAVYAAAAASLTACTRDMADRLADLLHSKLPRSRVVYCTSGHADQPSKRANSPSSNNAKKIWNLGHAFILVYTGNSPRAEPLLVEPNFRSHFELPRARRDYLAFLSTLPELLVVEAKQMQPLVAALSKCVAHEFKRMDLPLPPWRTASALQSRWQTDVVIKEHVIPNDSLSCAASHGSSSSGGDATSIVAPPSSSTISLTSSSPSNTTCNTPQVVVQGFHLPGAVSCPAPSATQAPLMTSAAGVPNNFQTAPRKREGNTSMLAQHQRADSKTLGGVKLALQSTASDSPSTHTARWQSFGQNRAKGYAAGECVCAECGHSKVPAIFKAKMVGWAAAAPSGRAHTQAGLQQLC